MFRGVARKPCLLCSCGAMRQLLRVHFQASTDEHSSAAAFSVGCRKEQA
jgi:hypothetical protein